MLEENIQKSLKEPPKDFIRLAQEAPFTLHSCFLLTRQQGYIYTQSSEVIFDVRGSVFHFRLLICKSSATEILSFLLDEPSIAVKRS